MKCCVFVTLHTHICVKYSRMANIKFSFVANPEIFSILWTAKFHYRVHNSPPPVPIVGQNNPLTAHHSCLYNYHITVHRENLNISYLCSITN